MAPTTRSSTLPKRSIGELNRLPLELRTEIYRHLLSTAYTAVPHAQEVLAGRTERRSDRSFDLYPNILRVSKWVNEEADRVLYNENLWVQVAFNFRVARGDPIGIHDHLKRRGPMGYIRSPQSLAVRDAARIGLGIKIIDLAPAANPSNASIKSSCPPRSYRTL